MENKGDNRQAWTTVITPEGGSIRSDLKELWQYRGLIRMFVKKDYKTMYAQTLLGPLWLILTAVLSSLVMTLVFGEIAELSTDGVPRFLFYLLGNILWMDFQGCVSKVAGTFLSYSGLMGKVYFPRLCVPIASVLSRQFQFAVQMLIFLGVYAYFLFGGWGLQCRWYILLMPLLLLQMLLLALGVGLIFTSLTVRFRDLSVVLTFILQFWMYATPVVYPASQIPGGLKSLLMLNPMAPVVETARFIWFGSGTYQPGYLLISAGMTVLVLAVAVRIFQRAQRSFTDTV